MIKKTILMLLVLVGGVMSANADGAMWLRSDVSSWSENLDEWKSEKTWDGTQDIYIFTVTAAQINDIGNATKDLYFRLYRDGNNYETCPYNQQDYQFKFENGQNETYDATSESEFQGTNGAFCIKHSEIQASEYKITVYLKYGSPWHYYIKAEIVSMPVKIGSSGYATFSCDRALNFEGTDIKAYVASNVNSTVVNMTSVTNAPAGTGLFLKGETEETANIPVIVTSEATAVSGNLLYPGTGESVASTNDTYRYVFQNQASGAGFYKLPTDGVVIPKGKSYLEIPASSAPQAPSFSIELNGETTGIKVLNFNEDNNLNNDRMFDLQGRRIVEPTRGVYIVNGKKVIIK